MQAEKELEQLENEAKKEWNSLSPEEFKKAPTREEVIIRLRKGIIEPPHEVESKKICPKCGKEAKKLHYFSCSIGAPMPFISVAIVYICFNCNWWSPLPYGTFISKNKKIIKI